jgi:cytochrome subunit of sulfide dehydrogenase
MRRALSAATSVPALLALLPALALAAAAPDPKVVEGCQDCHGANGVSTAQDVPSIAGISAVVQSDALKAYRARTRPCPKVTHKRGDTRREGDMCSVAKDLSDAQVADLAAYFAGKPYARMRQPADAAKAATGKAIYTRDCSKCHSSGGSDPADDAGILAGQPLAWLKGRLAALRKGDIDEPKMMQAVVSKLSDADIEALAQYYASEQ